MNYYITVELLNECLKASILDNEGSILNQIEKEYYKTHSNDCNNWYDTFKDAIYDLTIEYDRSDVMSIIISDVSSEITLLDRMDDPIRDALKLVRVDNDYILELLTDERIREYSGNYMLKKSLANTLLYIKKYEPESFQRISKILYRKDYLSYRLTGSYSIDSLTASKTQLYDSISGTWNGELLEFLEIDPTVLPYIYSPLDELGRLCEPDFLEMGFTMDTLIVQSTSDEELDKIMSLGTKDENIHLYLDEKGKLSYNSILKQTGDKDFKLFRSSFGKSLEIYISSSIVEENWLSSISNETFKIKDDYDILRIKDSFYIPKVTNSTGKVDGSFSNISFDMDSDDYMALFYEGCAFEIKYLIDSLKIKGNEIKGITVSGYPSRNPFFMNILSNCLDMNISIRRIDRNKTLALAMIEYVALEEYDSIESCVNELNPIIKTYIPKENLVTYYFKKYERYLKIKETI